MTQIFGSNIMSSYVGIFSEQAEIIFTNGQLIVNLGLNIFNFGLAGAGSLSMELLGCKAVFLGATILMTIFLIFMGVLTTLYENTGNAEAGNAMTAVVFFLPGSYCFAWTSLIYVFP